MTSDPVTLWGHGHLWYQASMVGDVRVTATSADPTTPVFVGIAPAGDAEAYLAGTHYSTPTHLTGGGDTVVTTPVPRRCARPTVPRSGPHP